MGSSTRLHILKSINYWERTNARVSACTGMNYVGGHAAVYVNIYYGWLFVDLEKPINVDATLKEAPAKKKIFKGSTGTKELNCLNQAEKHDIREGKSKTNIYCAFINQTMERMLSIKDRKLKMVGGLECKRSNEQKILNKLSVQQGQKEKNICLSLLKKVKHTLLWFHCFNSANKPQGACAYRRYTVKYMHNWFRITDPTWLCCVRAARWVYSVAFCSRKLTRSESTPKIVVHHIFVLNIAVQFFWSSRRCQSAISSCTFWLYKKMQMMCREGEREKDRNSWQVCKKPHRGVSIPSISSGESNQDSCNDIFLLPAHFCQHRSL